MNEEPITITPADGATVDGYTSQSIIGKLLEVAYQSALVGSLKITRS